MTTTTSSSCLSVDGRVINNNFQRYSSALSQNGIPISWMAGWMNTCLKTARWRRRCASLLLTLFHSSSACVWRVDCFRASCVYQYLLILSIPTQLRQWDRKACIVNWRRNHLKSLLHTCRDVYLLLVAYCGHSASHRYIPNGEHPLYLWPLFAQNENSPLEQLWPGCQIL